MRKLSGWKRLVGLLAAVVAVVPSPGVSSTAPKDEKASYVRNAVARGGMADIFVTGKEIGLDMLRLPFGSNALHPQGPFMGTCPVDLWAHGPWALQPMVHDPRAQGPMGPWAMDPCRLCLAMNKHLR